MDWVTGLLCATVAVYAFGSACALVFRLRRRADVEYGPLAVLGALVALLAWTRVAAVRRGGPAAADERVVTLLLVGAAVLLVHFALCYTRAAVASRRRWVRVAYGGGAAAGALTLVAPVHVADGRALSAWEFGVVALPLTPVGTLVHLAVVAALAGAAMHLARAYLTGNREALSLAVGTSALASSVAFDVLQALGLLHAVGLGQVGFVVLELGKASSFVTRYASVAGDLESRTAELEATTRALRRSYQDLHTTQEELVRKEQLAAVGELAAVVAHEVRNPLAVIANAVAGLRKPTLSKDDHATLLGILEEETRRLNRLVSDLLRYARPVSVQRSPIALSDLLDRPLTMAREAKIDVKTTDLGNDVCVSGDASLLRQVFDNLVENAVQAMSYGGTLTVGVEPKTEDGFDGLAIHITDTGEGMDTLVKNRATDPFFTTRPSGTGLGLAIVNRIVDAHGGHLLIASRPGEGTTVTVCLPSAPPASQKLPGSAPVTAAEGQP